MLYFSPVLQHLCVFGIAESSLYPAMDYKGIVISVSFEEIDVSFWAIRKAREVVC